MLSTAPVNQCTQTSTNQFDIRQAIGNPEFITNCANGLCANLDLGVVGFSPIYWVEEKPEYIHVGATREHMNSNSYNHWLQSTPAYGIWYSVQDYISNHPEQGKLALNDMALPYGGLFDIAGGWRPSHWNHLYGTATDVRANGIGQYSIPNNSIALSEFQQRCRDRGATTVLLESVGTSNQHIHCEWPNYI